MDPTLVYYGLKVPHNIDEPLNILAWKLSKNIVDPFLDNTSWKLWNSDVWYYKYSNYDKIHQPGKFDLSTEKFHDDNNEPRSEPNQSCMLTGSEEKDNSSIPKNSKEGFKICSQSEKVSIFGNKRDDLFYKTFGRDVRKFLQDDFTEFTRYRKENKGKDGAYFNECLYKYANYMNFHKDTSIPIENIICYLGSLINHREFKKAWPLDLLDMSYQVYNTFNLFTKERLYKLCWSEEFKLFFKYYKWNVNENNFFKRLTNHKTISENLDPYLYVYREFWRVCLNN